MQSTNINSNYMKYEESDKLREKKKDNNNYCYNDSQMKYEYKNINLKQNSHISNNNINNNNVVKNKKKKNYSYKNLSDEINKITKFNYN